MHSSLAQRVFDVTLPFSSNVILWTVASPKLPTIHVERLERDQQVLVVDPVVDLHAAVVELEPIDAADQRLAFFGGQHAVGNVDVSLVYPHAVGMAEPLGHDGRLAGPAVAYLHPQNPALVVRLHPALVIGDVEFAVGPEIDPHRTGHARVRMYGHRGEQPHFVLPIDLHQHGRVRLVGVVRTGQNDVPLGVHRQAVGRGADLRQLDHEACCVEPARAARITPAASQRKGLILRETAGIVHMDASPFW